MYNLILNIYFRLENVHIKGTKSSMLCIFQIFFFYYTIIIKYNFLYFLPFFSQASLDLGTDKHGFGFGGTGKKSNDRQFISYGEAFGMKDVIGCMLDLDSCKMSFSKNGKDLGVAFNIPNSVIRTPLFPAVCLKVRIHCLLHFPIL